MSLRHQTCLVVVYSYLNDTGSRSTLTIAFFVRQPLGEWDLTLFCILRHRVRTVLRNGPQIQLYLSVRRVILWSVPETSDKCKLHLSDKDEGNDSQRRFRDACRLLQGD